MDVKIDAIERNNTWELTELLKKQNNINMKWIYKTKMKKNCRIDKHKAWLVVKGYKQEFDIDYKEFFTLFARHNTNRLVITLATQNSWSIFQLDVKLAFLDRDLEE